MNKFLKSFTIVLLTLMGGILAFSKDLNSISKITQMEKYKTFIHTFKIANNEIDLNNYESLEIENNSHIYRFRITKNNELNYLTVVIKNNSKDPLFIYEKSDYQNGFIEQYNEKGNFLMDFKIQKLGDSKTVVKLNDLLVSERLGLNSLEKLSESEESWIECVSRIKATIEEACDNNDTCAIACDLSSSCATYMYAVAAARCTVD